MGGGHDDLGVDEGAAALVQVEGRLVGLDALDAQHGHHPGELAELRLAVQVSGDAKTDALRVAAPAAEARRLRRRRDRLVQRRRLAAHVQVALAGRLLDSKKFIRKLITNLTRDIFIFKWVVYEQNAVQTIEMF